VLPTYWERTQWPLQSLVFLTPLLLVYEAGAVAYAQRGSGPMPAIWAESLLASFFEWFGVTGYLLPPVLVVGVLLVWHMLRDDPWELEPKLYLGMTVESVLLAVPLFVFMLVLFQTDPAGVPAAVVGQATANPNSALTSLPGGGWRMGILLSLGAGIYEELVFRLIAIAVVHALLADLLKLPETWAAVGAVTVSALAFAFYHFSEANPFQVTRFVFYVVAGVYFAAVYTLRGFGVVVASHAVYDVFYVTMTAAAE
jgi:membrane protease YdiL (CAAX protease family)